MVGAGLMQNVHFVLPGEAQLELILDGDFVWVDLHDTTVQLHYVAEQVFEEILRHRGRRVADHRLRLQHPEHHGHAGARQPHHGREAANLARRRTVHRLFRQDRRGRWPAPRFFQCRRAHRGLCGARPQSVAAGRNLVGEDRDGRSSSERAPRRGLGAGPGARRARGAAAVPTARAGPADATVGAADATVEAADAQRTWPSNTQEAGADAAPAATDGGVAGPAAPNAVIPMVVRVAAQRAGEGDAEADRGRGNRRRRGCRRRDRHRRALPADAPRGQARSGGRDRRAGGRAPADRPVVGSPARRADLPRAHRRQRRTLRHQGSRRPPRDPQDSRSSATRRASCPARPAIRSGCSARCRAWCRSPGRRRSSVVPAPTRATPASSWTAFASPSCFTWGSSCRSFIPI